MRHRITAIVVSLLVSSISVAQTPCFSFTRLSRPSPSLYPIAGTSGDFNHDGRTDLVIYYSTTRGLEVFLGSPTGGLIPAGTYFGTAPPPVTAVDAADLDGDGNLDLIASVGNDLVVLTGKGDGTFIDGPVMPVGAGAFDVEVADLTGDGIPDVVASLQSAPLLLLRGLGGGAFASPVTIAVLGSHSIAIADFDSDGRLDIAGTLGPVLAVVFNQGGGSYDSAAFSTLQIASNAPDAIVATDYDFDGDVDVLIALGGSGTAVLRNNGNRTFTAATVLAPLTPSHSLALADFNGDGKADLLVSGDGGFNILLANGDGTYAAPRFTRTTPPNTIGTNLGPFITGDFRGIGRVDVALGLLTFVSSNTHSIDVFLNDCGPPALPALSPLAAFVALFGLAAAGWWMSRG